VLLPGSQRSLILIRPVRIVLYLIVVALLALAAAMVVTLTAPAATPLGRLAPGPVAYSVHASLGIALNTLGLSPAGAATQWSRAASHASNPAEVDQAARGIARARERSAADWRIDDVLCEAYSHGAPEVRTAILAANVPCSPDADVFAHVPVGEPLPYTSRPPVGGPHYAQPYPDYGLTDAPVDPGYWVHNLEHGAVVLLYRCPAGCLGVVTDLQAVYDSLPDDTEVHHGVARMLITEDDDMDHAFAIVAWGRKFEMDRLDREQVLAFYAAHINRGPECRNLVCPA